jgi:hypothetical protein
VFARPAIDGRFGDLLADPNLGRYPGLHYEVYPQDAFRTVESEQQVRITRSPKRTGDDGLSFWLAAELADDWTGREQHFPGFVRGAAFRAVSEAEFNTLVDRWSGDLLARPALPLHPSTGFVGALVMREAEDDLIVSAVAEYDDEFIHFAWESSA